MGSEPCMLLKTIRALTTATRTRATRPVSLTGGTGSRRGKGLSSGLNRGFPPWLEAGSCLHTGLNSWARRDETAPAPRD
jgi:hypothetical protein